MKTKSMNPISPGARAVLCAIITLASLIANPASAATYQWNASSGLFPDQVAPPMSLFDGSSPENPQLSNSVLTIQNDVHSEYLYYAMSDSALNVPFSLIITAEVRFVSGATSFSSRTGTVIGFGTKHVEHQARRDKEIGWRLFTYAAWLMEQYRLPVYPIRSNLAGVSHPVQTFRPGKKFFVTFAAALR